MPNTTSAPDGKCLASNDESIEDSNCLPRQIDKQVVSRPFLAPSERVVDANTVLHCEDKLTVLA